MSPMSTDVLNQWVMYDHLVPDADHLVAAEHEDATGIDEERWVLQMPHSCDEWVIAAKPTKAEAVATARAFIAEVEDGIRRLEAL